ncbi:MAG: TetR/AcrR family transcriptional regulator [Spirochaetales bacterium]|nr:TetR/AcrR family transcriptional regulator [Spirochaetales bacterium]
MDKIKNDKDIRCIKTKRAIMEALKQLMKEKAVEQVSVSEITRLALISRSTFYAHYESVFSVLDELEEDLMNQMVELMEKTEISTLSDDPFPFSKQMSKLIYENIDIYQYIINSPRPNNLENKIREMSKANFLDSVAEKMNVSHEEATLMGEFTAAGTEAVYKYWFNSDRTMSLDEVSRLVARMNTIIVKGLMRDSS